MIIAKKLKMSRIYDQNDKQVPVTFLHILPSKIIKDRKDQIVLCVETNTSSAKPQQETLKQAGFKKGFVFTLKDSAFYNDKGLVDYDKLKENGPVTIKAVSKGKGFAGVIKRHNFGRGPTTHGSDHHRAPGSIGSAYPQRVVPGKKMPGHLGAVNTTVKKVKIVDFDEKNQIIAVKGAIPGPNKGIIRILP